MFKYYRLIRERLSSAYQRRSLIEILTTADPAASLSERAIWLYRLFDWIGSPVTPHGEVSEHRAPSLRLKFVIRMLTEHPDLRVKMRDTLVSICNDVDPLDFFCDAGMITSQGFFRELMVRIVFRYLPSHKDYSSLSVLTEAIVDGEDDAEWIEELDPFLLQELWSLLNFDEAFKRSFQAKLRLAIEHASRILAARLASLSSVPEFRVRVPEVDRFLLIDMPANRSQEILLRAWQVIQDVYQSLEGTGVSIELVFLLERMKGLLHRLHLLHSFAHGPIDIFKNLSMISEILRAQEEKNSIVGFLNSNLELISKKIVDRAGVTGENYIARTGKESRQLFWTAAGGGILTVGTTIIKSAVTHLNLPLFFEGFMAWLNYTLSFTLIQIAHWTLATKTPAMTASVLAGKLKEVKPGDDQTEFVQEVRRIARSGLIAVLGNVIFVMAGAAALDFILFKITGHHIFTEKNSHHYLDVHHILLSLTIWYATYTGGVLWLGSAIGGWFENWYTYRGLPQAVEESYFLQSAFGKTGAQRISRWLSASLMGLATNVALGFFLAFSTVFGKFFGIPIDVRHVTLSSGTLAFSLMGMGIEGINANVSLVVFAVLSIGVIGFLNFSVSFLISLIVAAQAREIKLKQYPRLLRSVFSFRKIQQAPEKPSLSA